MAAKHEPSFYSLALAQPIRPKKTAIQSNWLASTISYLSPSTPFNDVKHNLPPIAATSRSVADRRADTSTQPKQVRARLQGPLIARLAPNASGSVLAHGVTYNNISSTYNSTAYRPLRRTRL